MTKKVYADVNKFVKFKKIQYKSNYILKKETLNEERRFMLPNYQKQTKMKLLAKISR